MQDAVTEARTAVDALRAHRAMRRKGDTVSAESLRRGAVAAAALETGTTLSPARDQHLFAGPAPGREAAEDVAADGLAARAVRGAGRAYGELGAVRAAWSRSPLQVLARLHLLTARDVVPPDVLGRPRSGHDQLRPAAYDRALDRAPTAEVVTVRLEGLTAVLAATTAPALVVAAVVHGELATLRPFAWGNQIVALGAQRLVLVERGLDPQSQSVVEVGHLELADAHRAALVAYATGEPAGLAQWIAHCGRAVVAGAREGLAICEALGR